MIKEGCMVGVDECYGYHNVPLEREGVLMIKPHIVMVGISVFNIKVIGKGGHGSYNNNYLFYYLKLIQNRINPTLIVNLN